MFVSQSMSSVFNSMRQKFGMTFSKIRDTMKEASTNFKNLKTFLWDCYLYLSPQLAHTRSNTLDDILEIAKEKCTLIDVGILKAIAMWVSITKADVQIKAYDAIEKFCCTVTTHCIYMTTFSTTIS